MAHLDGSEYTTGGAVGVDTYVLRKMVPWVPEAHHRVCLPTPEDWDNKWLPLADEIVRVPDTMNNPHRSRNAAILEKTDYLLAFPLSDEEDTSQSGGRGRSGTWMTIRMARQLHIPMMVTVLSEWA
jgi:hypothetical protein